MLDPACDAVIVQLPTLARVRLAVDPDWLSMEQEPVGLVALKLTDWLFAAPLVCEVALTETGVPTTGGADKGFSTMVWLYFNTAGTDGALERDVGSMGTGSSVVAIV